MWLALLAFVGLQAAAPAPGFASAQPVPTSEYRVETVASGLDAPWSIAFLPGGDILVTERPGRLRLIVNGRLSPTPVAGAPAVFVESQAGLFEAMPHPNFETNQLLYITYVYRERGRNTLRLSRARLVRDAQGARLQGLRVLFTADAWRDTTAQYGGRMAFLPDGTLLLTVGDGFHHPTDAQRLSSHFGKILRLDENGVAPVDNPFVGRAGARPEIWSYGHRNPQGVVVAADGTVYASEHGPSGGDEVNVIVRGANYGWPLATYGMNYAGAQVSPYTTYPNTVQPIFYWRPSIAPSSLVIYEHDLFPAFRGRLISTGLSGEEVRIADPARPRAPQVSLLSHLGVRMRDVAVAPDGRIFVATEGRGGGQILALSPAR